MAKTNGVTGVRGTKASQNKLKGDQKGANDTQTITKDAPVSLAIAEKGIKTGADFAGLMSALMSDVIAGRIPPATASAAVNAGGKLLKVVEMQHKYGQSPKKPTLELPLV